MASTIEVSGQDQSSTRTGRAISFRVCCAPERNGQIEEWGQIKVREEQDRITTVASKAVVKLEADLEQTKCMARKRYDRAGEARTWGGKARAGYGRIMPKKDMA